MKIVINESTHEHIKIEAFNKFEDDSGTYWRGYRVYNEVQFESVSTKLKEIFQGLEIYEEPTAMFGYDYVYLKLRFNDPADEAYFISVSNDTTITVDIPNDNFIVDDDKICNFLN